MITRASLFRITITAIIIVIAFSFGTQVLAQSASTWFDLKPGAYAVGFKTVEKYDYSRVFRPKYDYFGTPLEGERARPIQICIWYPAIVKIKTAPMVYGEYSFPYPENTDFFDIITRVQDRERNYLFGLFNPNRGLPLDLMSVNMTAVKDATPADGRFPLIIYCSDLQGSYSENAILCEYLAGQGYVVAATHSLGTRDANPVTTQGDLETLLSDKEFILAAMRDIPFVDKDKLGVMGMGFGGLESLLLAMRNPDIDAMVSLRGIFIYSANFDFVRQCPYYGIVNLHAPALQMYPSEADNLDLSLFESLRFSSRYSAKLQKLQNRDFSDYILLSSMVPGIKVENLADKKAGYQAICRYTAEFFNAYLKKDANSLKFFEKSPTENGIASGCMEIKYLAQNDLPPNEDQLLAIIREKGAKTAAEIYDKFKAANPDHLFFREGPCNALGYQYLQRNQIEDAVILFKMNTEAYPRSCNVWDSYADGLTAQGDSAGVRKALTKALEVMPADSITDEQTKEAIRAHANQVLGTSGN
jgi:hypothetical protein